MYTFIRMTSGSHVCLNAGCWEEDDVCGHSVRHPLSRHAHGGGGPGGLIAQATRAKALLCEVQSLDNDEHAEAIDLLRLRKLLFS